MTLTERAPRLLEQLRAPRRVLPVTLPLLALVLASVVVHTGGRHIDLEVYRFGVQAWLAGGDMYGPLPETSDHITLPFIYPPFAAIVLLPLAVAPWSVAWTVLLALSTAALGLTFFVVARRLWPSGGRGRRAVRRVDRAAAGAAGRSRARPSTSAARPRRSRRSRSSR